MSHQYSKEFKKIFNGPTSAYFLLIFGLFKHTFYSIKTVCFSGIRPRIVGSIRWSSWPRDHHLGPEFKQGFRQEGKKKILKCRYLIFIDNGRFAIRTQDLNWMLFTRSLEKRFHNMLNWKQKLMFYFKSKKAIYLFIFYCNILGAFATICWLLVRYDSRFTCISHQKREFKNRKGGSGGVQMKKVTKKLVQIKNKFAYLNGER